ncbi:MAG: bestrophin family ion channel [Cyanobacteria bacterium P01_G01_bin.39]
MSLENKATWLETAFQLDGSVVSKILPRIIFFSVFAALVCLTKYWQNKPEFLIHIGDLTNNVVYNLVLGLLLVFRTNTSYERFWDGRKSLGMLVVNIRNLARSLRLSISKTNQEQQAEKTEIFKLLSAFAVATKLQLREEPADDELKALLGEKRGKEIESAKRMSLQIALWIGEHIQKQFKLGRIDSSEKTEMNAMLNNMIEGLSSCERISKTPLPIAYRIYLKRLILIYCLGLPFNLIQNMQWWAIPITAVVSFILLGLEEVGKELENPFLYGKNDLPVNALCRNIATDVDSIANFKASESVCESSNS